MSRTNRPNGLPPEVQAALKAMLGGRAQKSDYKALGEWMSSARSLKDIPGVKQAMAKVSDLRSLTDAIEDFGQKMNSGTTSSADVAKISREVLKRVEQAATSRFGKQMAVRAAQAMGRNPRAALGFLRGAGRVAGVAGVAAEWTQKVFDAAEAVQAGRQSYWGAVGATKEANRGFGDSVYARKIEASTRARVYKSLPMMQRAGIGASRWAANKFGGGFNDVAEWASSGAEEQVAREQSRQAGLVAVAQRNLPQMVASDAVASAAARAGVPVSMMGQLAQQDALQGAALTQIQSAKGSAGADQYVQSKLASRTWSEKLYDSTFGNAGDQERKLREEFSEKQMKTVEAMVKDHATMNERRRAVGMYPESYSVAEVQQQRRQEEAAQAQARSFRSRHKAVIDD